MVALLVAATSLGLAAPAARAREAAVPPAAPGDETSVAWFSDEASLMDRLDVQLVGLPGRIDPGDGVGLLPYAWGALTQSQFAWAAAASDDVASTALSVQPAVQAALAWAGFTRDAALEVAHTSELSRARELTFHVLRATSRVAATVDPAGDSDLERALEELAEDFGVAVTPAHAEARLLVQVSLLPPNAMPQGVVFAPVGSRH
jgi:hypothetical protein